jgi:hypothetical protein
MVASEGIRAFFLVWSRGILARTRFAGCPSGCRGGSRRCLIQCNENGESRALLVADRGQAARRTSRGRSWPRRCSVCETACMGKVDGDLWGLPEHPPRLAPRFHPLAYDIRCRTSPCSVESERLETLLFAERKIHHLRMAREGSSCILINKLTVETLATDTGDGKEVSPTRIVIADDQRLASWGVSVFFRSPPSGDDGRSRGRKRVPRAGRAVPA